MKEGIGQRHSAALLGVTGDRGRSVPPKVTPLPHGFQWLHWMILTTKSPKTFGASGFLYKITTVERCLVEVGLSNCPFESIAAQRVCVFRTEKLPPQNPNLFCGPCFGVGGVRPRLPQIQVLRSPMPAGQVVLRLAGCVPPNGRSVRGVGLVNLLDDFRLGSWPESHVIVVMIYRGHYARAYARIRPKNCADCEYSERYARAHARSVQHGQLLQGFHHRQPVKLPGLPRNASPISDSRTCSR